MSNALNRPLEVSVREQVYKAITTPPIQYAHDTGSAYTLQTLPASAVISRAVWLTGGDNAPDPFIAYEVGGDGDVGRHVPGVRKLRLFVWVVVRNSVSQAVEIYEAVRARLQFADYDPGWYSFNLDTQGGTHQRPLQVDECVERLSPPCSFDTTTARWYKYAEFDMKAY